MLSELMMGHHQLAEQLNLLFVCGLAVLPCLQLLALLGSLLYFGLQFGCSQ